MSAVATRDPETRRPEAERPEAPTQRLFEPQGPTLEDAILATWQSLVSDGCAQCPVCGDEMRHDRGCPSCSSSLS